MTGSISQWGTLLIEYLKRDWKVIAVWVVGLGAFSGGFVPLFEEMGKGGGFIGFYEIMKNPAMVAMVGTTPVQNAADYDLGAVYSHMMLLFCALFAMIIAALHVVAHSRKEEDSGLLELVASFGAGRHAASFALVLEELIVSVLLALCTAGIMVSFGNDALSVEGCMLYGAGVGAAGMMGAVVALVAAQVMPASAGATGVSLLVVGGMYSARAATDISNADATAFIPMGWTYITYPFTTNDAWPLLWCVLFCVVVVAVAFCLESGRDMGAGYVREREGRGHVSPLLLSVPGLLLRLNRGVVAAWLVAFFVLGAAYGSIYGDMQAFLDSSDMMQAMFAADGITIEASFTAVITVVMAGLASVLPVVVVNRLYAEESAGRFEQLQASRVSRAKLFGVTIAIAAVSGAVALVLSGAGLGCAALAVMDDCSLDMVDFVASSLAYFPAMMFVAALSAAALGWLPRVRKAVYAYLAFSVMVSYFKGILDMPQWLENAAVFSWVARMPLDEFDPTLFMGVLVVACVLLIVAAVGYVRRDSQEGRG